MTSYISIDKLIELRNSINSSSSNKKIDTFVGIILLLLSSQRVSEYYYKANMSIFSNYANDAFTLKELNKKHGDKVWYALFTPTWAERSLKQFLSGRKIKIDSLLATIFWQKDSQFIANQKDKLKHLIGENDFYTLFDECDIVFTSSTPINRNELFKKLKNGSLDNNPTIKYDGSFIQKDAGDLNAAVYGQTLYSGLEIKKIINIFEFDIIDEIKLNDENFGNDRQPSTKDYIPELENGLVESTNTLLYGVSGVGKSYFINQQLGNLNGENEHRIERVVFHPDYLNADFVGQILPTVKKGVGITYEFKAGPFTRILKKAFDNPDQHHYLVIEEINRGNAPAIFGEIFQLLDRNSNGESEYKISNDLIAGYINGVLDRNSDDEVFNENLKIQNNMIFIPSNLSIYATMNTADQNVFTLDTAFQRRWTMQMMENNIEQCGFRNVVIGDTGVTWGRFNTELNNIILQSNKNTLSSEDKRLGAYFVKPHELTIQDGSCLFAEKVIKYLWDDVFKFKKSELFRDDLDSLDQVLNEFKNGIGSEKFNIFVDSVRHTLLSSQKPSTEDAADASGEFVFADSKDENEQ